MDDFSHLSPAEYEKISNVLKRDRELRNAEEARIRQLKQELVCLRKRAALKPGLDPHRNCARCLTELGRILNRGALCPICLKKVCKDCRHYGDETHEWLCIYCFKQMQLKAISGEWMQEFSRLSIRTCAKETPADQVRKVLHESQRKGLLESDVIEKKSARSAESPPQKPPRIFTYEQLEENVVSESSKEDNANDLEVSLNERNGDSSKPDMDPTEALTASPRILPRVSPWNGIDPEPTIPVRVDKSRPFGTVHEFSDPSPFRERQSSDEGHCTIGYRSRSTSSEIIDESENLAPVPLPRKRLSPLKKQQAVPEPNPVDHQQSSVDTTDSGVCSPGLKAEGLIDANIPSSPRVAQRFTSIDQESANFSSNRPSSFAQRLASESSLSESDKEQQGEPNLKSNGILFRKVTLRKRKSSSGTRSVVKKHSVASEDVSTVIPPLGLNPSFLNNKLSSNLYHQNNVTHKKVNAITNPLKSNSRSANFDGKKKRSRTRLLTLSNSHSNETFFSEPLRTNPEALSVGRKSLADDDKGDRCKKSEDKRWSSKLAANKEQRESSDINPKQSSSLFEETGQFSPSEFTFKHTKTKEICKCSACVTVRLNCLNSRYAHRKLQKSQKCRTVSFDSRSFSSTDIPVRSVSVPNFKTYSEDFLQSWMWKCHSLEDWLWYLEDEPCRPRDFREIASMLPSDYKLVYVSSTSSDSDNSSPEYYSDEKYKSHFRYSRKLAARSKDHLKVHSRFKMKYGTSYVDDSDWEFQSDESDNLEINCNRKESPTHSFYNSSICSSSTETTGKSPQSLQCCFDSMNEYYCNLSLSRRYFSESLTNMDFAFNTEPDCIRQNNLSCPSNVMCKSITHVPSGKNKIVPSSHIKQCPVSIIGIELSNKRYAGRNPNTPAVFPNRKKILAASVCSEIPSQFPSHLYFSRTQKISRLICQYEGNNNFQLYSSNSYRNVLHIASFLKQFFTSLSFVDLFNGNDFTRKVKDNTVSAPSNFLQPYLTDSSLTSTGSRILTQRFTHGHTLIPFMNCEIGFTENALNSLGKYTIERFDPTERLSRTSPVALLLLLLNEVLVRNELDFDTAASLFSVCEAKISLRSGCGEFRTAVPLGDANALDSSLFPPCCKATNRGNDSSATGWGKARCCIAAETQRVIDLNLGALDYACEVLDSADLTLCLGWTAAKLGALASLADAFFYGPPVIPKPEADFSLTTSDPCLLSLRSRRMIAGRSEGTGLGAFDKVENDKTCSSAQSKEVMQSKRKRLFSKSYQLLSLENDSPWLKGRSRRDCKNQDSTEKSTSRLCLENVNKHCLFTAGSTSYSDSLNVNGVIDVKVVNNNLCVKIPLKENEKAVNKMDLDYMDQEILPYIKNIFHTDIQDIKSLQICKYELPIDEPILYDCFDANERVDCQCHKPCDVPSSPSVIDATIERTLPDDGEVFSSGDELDKLESDTDSQDTVIEGEAYKRIRSVAIKEKILHANEELFGASAKDCFETSNEACVEQIATALKLQRVESKPKKEISFDRSHALSPLNFLVSQNQNNVSEQQTLSGSDESASLGVIFSLDKHFPSFKGQTLSAFHPILPSSFTEQKNNDCYSSKDGDNVSVSYKIAFNEATCSSESSDNGSDGEEVILSDTSTSSDEATYIAPAYGFQFYHHPASYRLHTIAEESCEESEKSSRGATPTCKSVCDFEYFDKVRLSSSRSPKKMHRKSPVDNAAGSPISEHKNGKGSPSHSVLASSRLEKYFKSGIFESNHASYHDDDLTDESGGVSSDEEVAPISSKEKIGSQALHEKLYDKYFNSKNQVAKKNQKELSNSKTGNLRASNLSSYHNAEQIFRQAFEIQMLDNPVASASHVENSTDIKQGENTEPASDDEATYIMSHLMQHITNNSEEEIQTNTEVKDVSPMIKILESEIARLMLTVSPASLSAGEPSSSCSSTIGSNNSDYGSDTLESAEDSTSDEEISVERVPENRALVELPPEVDSSTSQNVVSVAHSSEECPSTSDSIASEETLYICKQLMASLKKIANVSEDGDDPSELNVDAMDDHSAKQYITNQIVSLMQTVSASQHNSPLLRRLNSNHSPILLLDSDASQYRSDSDSPAPNDDKRDHSKSKTPSESGSETTISASISIPSYDDSDRTPTESEISHEMDELYALLESNGSSQDVIASAKLYDFDSQSLDKGFPLRNSDSPLSEDDTNFAFSESSDGNSNTLGSESSLLYGAASKLESLLPISIEERIARYKDAFLNKMTDNRDSEYKSCETRINVILPQPPMLENENYQELPYDSSLPPSSYPSSNFALEETNSVTEQTEHFGRNTSSYMDNIEENNYNITSVKIISHNTYPLSSAIHKILSNNIDSTYLEKKLDYKIVNIPDASEDVPCENAENAEITEPSDLPIDTIQLSESNEPSIISPLPKVMNPKEKASSENDLLVANYRAKSKGNNVFGTKSVGNITELENIANKSTFRDTGYYSFKSSEESFLSLDDSTASQTSTTSLTQYRSLTSTETIPEEEETCAKVTPPTKMSLSSSNIPDAISDTSPKSSTLPLSLRNKFSATPGGNHRTRSSFFSTSGVLRKLTLLRDESGNSLRSSPHGRLRMRNRSLSGGSEDDRHRKASLPQIAVSECTENQVGRLSAASSEKESSGVQEDDLDQAFAYHCRSQMSLSSFGGRSESVTSVYSAAGGGRYGTVIVTGEVLFGLNYNYKTGTLEINVKECRNLAAVDTKRNRSDPYVKVYLLPDRTKGGKRKTKVKKHTLSPVFDELLKFHVTVSELEIRTLWLSVWHSDRFGRNDFLGEVMLPLGNDAFDSTGLKWYPLQERMEALETPVSYKGDLILALKYVPPDVTSRKFSKKPGSPAKGALEVLVREARNLMATRSNGTSDPFCKSYLLPDKSKAGKQKTPVFKKSCNPKWNHTFLYDDVSLEDLRERCLELTIWDYDKITSNDFLGGVRLCLGAGKYQGRDVEWMDSVGEEQSLWYTMLERPNTWVDGSLLLRPTMQSRRTV